MKKKVLLWGVTIALSVLGVFAAPGMVESAIPSVYYITPAVTIYENIVNCIGVIQPGSVYKVYASGSMAAGAVHVELGDIVEEGRLLLTVDSERTQRLNRGAVSSVIDEVTGPVQNGLADIIAAFSALGIPGIADGFDLSGIAGVLGQDSASAGGSSVAVIAEDEITEIFAPAAGVIAEIGIVPGGVAAPGSCLFTIHDIKSFKVTANVNEADISKLSLGNRAQIRGAGFPGVSYEGVVTAISPIAYKALAGTAAETVVDVEIRILNPNNKLRPGFTARAEITGENRHELITIPYESIRQDERNNEYVYLYENGRLVRSGIVTGREMTNEVEVLHGVRLDSIVVYNPDDVPGEGAMVRIVDRK
ncbi:MAG: efflux RND transporter periplasmic adaptor subunit [Oscillospiraceae bacterium]|nr:efflux RND transporter periplasmic adaptor subunit [Oscillospiraceae bacterium]